MSSILGSVFTLVGAGSTLIGRYGSIISFVVWLLGAMSILPAISFMWVVGMFALLCVGVVTTVFGLALLGAR